MGTELWLIVSVFYPETARKTLEELDFIFMKPEDRPTVAMQDLTAGKNAASGHVKPVAEHDENHVDAV